MTTTTEAPALTPECRARADSLAARATDSTANITATAWPSGYSEADKLRAVACGLGWNAYAAGEYPRATLQDAVNVADLAPDLALTAWHHAAGATIDVAAAPWCCGTPASHRDALADLGRVLRDRAHALTHAPQED